MTDIASLGKKIAGRLWPPEAILRRLSAITMKRLIIASGAAVMSGIVLFSAVDVNLLYVDEEQSINQKLESISLALAGHADQAIGNVDSVLQDAAHMMRVNGAFVASTSKVHELLRAKISGLTQLRGIGVFDADGRAVYNSRRYPPEPISIADRAFFKAQKRLQSERLVISEIVANRFDGRPNIVVSRPIIDDSGTWRGIVAASVDPAFFEDFFASLKLPAGSVVAIFNEEGKLLVRVPSIKDNETRDYSGRPLFKAVKNDPDGSAFSKAVGFDDVSRYLALHRADHYGLIVAVGIEEHAAMAAWRKQASVIVLMGVGGIIAVGLLLWAVIWHLNRIAYRNALLVASEAKFRGLITATPDAMLVVNTAGHIELANEQAMRLFGYGITELIGLPLERLLPERYRETHGQHLRRYFGNPKPRAMNTGQDLHGLSKAGHEIPVEISLSSYREREGLMTIAAIRDVTARKQIELKLRKSQNHLARAQKIVGVGSFERDLHTDQVEWSDETNRILGRDPSLPPLTKQEFVNIVHPDDRPIYEASMTSSEKGLATTSLDIRINRPDGVQRWIHVEADVIFDENGAPARRIGTYMDVTEAREKAEALRRSNELLQRSEWLLAWSQRIAKMGSSYRDLRTDAAEWSEESYRIFGVSRDNFIPTTENVLAMVHPEDRTAITTAIEQIARNVCPTSFAFRVIRPDGIIRHIHRETKLILDETGNSVGLVGTIHDVTELSDLQERQKELEHQLMHAQKLEALGTLVGGVAHELNNALTPIVALSKLALHDLPIGGTLHANNGIVIRAAERARGLVAQILAFSRKDEIAKEEFDLAAITREAVQMMRLSLPSTIEIDDRIEDGLALNGNAGQLHQVIVNLIINAAHAIGHDQGKIIVTVSPAAGTLLRSGRTFTDTAIRLSVSDTGCGMDTKTIERIFDPFFTTKPVGEGTGLGLSVVHGIVTSHGGRIDVRSTPGKGSEFVVLLPKNDATLVAKPSDAAAA